MPKRKYLASRNNQFLQSISISIFTVGIILSLVIVTKSVSQSHELRSRANGNSMYASSPDPACKKESCSIRDSIRHCADKIPPRPKQGLLPIPQVHAQLNVCLDYNSCYQKCQYGTDSCSKTLVWSECSLQYAPTPTPTPIPGITQQGTCSPTCAVNACNDNYFHTQQICSFGIKSKWGNCAETCQANETRPCETYINGMWMKGQQSCKRVRKSIREYCDVGYWGICDPSEPS